MRCSPLFAVALLACSSSDAKVADSATAGRIGTARPTAGSVAATTSAGAVQGDSSAATAAPSTAPSVRPAAAADLPIIRGLYVNRFAAQSAKRMRKLIAIADSTEINAFVIDVKDEFGLNIPSQEPLLQKNAGKAGVIPNVRQLLDTLKAHDILAVARIVVFKDSVAARANPDHVIRKTDGSAWRDKQGLTWVNPYDESIWEYNFRVAEEAVKLGFGEIQFDYIRFPEPYPSLPKQVFPSSNDLSKPAALAAYLKDAKTRLNKLGVRSTADIFGLVTTVNGALEVGQDWEKISPVVDVVLPMVYPSHYPHGELGVKNPNAEPYKIIHTAISRARERDKKLGVSEPEHIRPWLQAFTLGKPPYGADELREQKKAVYDAGYDGWVMWNPGSIYDVFMPALEKTLESRKK